MASFDESRTEFEKLGKRDDLNAADSPIQPDEELKKEQLVRQAKPETSRIQMDGAEFDFPPDLEDSDPVHQWDAPKNSESTKSLRWQSDETATGEASNLFSEQQPSTDHDSLMDDELILDGLNDDLDQPDLHGLIENTVVEPEDSFHSKGVFNLDRPSSLAAAAAEAREYYDEESAEELEFLTDIIFDRNVELSSNVTDHPKPGPPSDELRANQDQPSDDSQAIDDGSERGESQLVSETSEMEAPIGFNSSDESTVQDMPVASHGLKQPSAKDTLTDPELGRLLADSGSLDTPVGFGVVSQEAAMDNRFRLPDEKPSTSTAADTIREVGPWPASPEIEKERFSILESQIDELEKENELLNDSLLVASKEAERFELTSAAHRKLIEHFESAMKKNAELESQLVDLKLESELSQAFASDQLEALQSQLDAAYGESAQLRHDLELAQNELVQSQGGIGKTGSQ